MGVWLSDSYFSKWQASTNRITFSVLYLYVLVWGKMYSKLYWCKADVLHIVLKSLSGVVSKKFPHLGASFPSHTWILRMVLINIMSHDVPCLLFLLVDCWRHMLCRSWIRGKFECFTKFGKHFGFPQYTLWLWRGRVVNFSGKLSLSIFSNIQGVFLNCSSPKSS